MKFSDRLWELVDRVRVGGGKPSRSELSPVIDQLFDNAVREAATVVKREQATKTKGGKRERNPLFDALAEATGTKDVTRITKNEGIAIGQALAQIKEACPEVTPEDIRRAVSNYRRRWTDPRNLTPRAVASHWSQVAGGRATEAELLDPYQSPPRERWVAYLRKHYANTPFVDNIDEKKWGDIPTDMRLEIKRVLFDEDRKAKGGAS